MRTHAKCLAVLAVATFVVAASPAPGADLYPPTAAIAAATTVICPSCSFVNNGDATFCSNCGAKLPVGGTGGATTTNGQEKMCPQCGALTDKDARFCSGCGYTFATRGTTRKPTEKNKRSTLVGTFGFDYLRAEGVGAPGATFTAGGRVNAGSGSGGSSPIVSLSGGMGYYKWPNARNMPLFFQMRLDFLRGSISPMMYVDGGYVISKLTEPEVDVSGPEVSIGGGMDFYFMPNVGFTVNVGYQRLMSQIVYYNPWTGEEISREPVNYNCFRFNTGVIF